MDDATKGHDLIGSHCTSSTKPANSLSHFDSELKVSFESMP